MSLLAQVYAQGGDVILHTLELTSTAWGSDPIVLVKDYQDHVITTEDGRQLLARATGMAVALPKRDTTGAQDLTFALDGVRPEATRLVRQAQEAQATVRVIYRCYLYSDLSEPAEPPLFLIARRYTAQMDHIEVTAGLFDLIDMRWPRMVYDSNTAPCLEFSQ